MIGVLALQGGFYKHLEVLKKLKVPSCKVRYPEDLSSCSGLILPGGESTTLLRLLKANGLLEPLSAFKKPVFGTCAGLIVMEKLKMLDITIQRNAYGRQSASFCTELRFSHETLPAIFIRAPRILEVGLNVKVLGRISPPRLPSEPFDNLPVEATDCLHANEQAVLIQENHHLGASFHPELSEDTRIHEYFCRMCEAFPITVNRDI